MKETLVEELESYTPPSRKPSSACTTYTFSRKAINSTRELATTRKKDKKGREEKRPADHSKGLCTRTADFTRGKARATRARESLRS